MVAAFSVPNLVDASAAEQARLQSTHLAAIVNALNGTGVDYGGAVVQRAAGANMSVDVAYCVALSQSKQMAVAAANKTIAAADATNPRFDLVYISSAGAITVATGSPVAVTSTTTPAIPAIPAGAIALAAVRVPAAATSIVNANLTGLQCLTGAGLPTNWVNVVQYGAIGDATTQNNTAYANAVAAVPVNGTLYIPPGTYLGNINCKSNMRVVGAGVISLLRSDGVGTRGYCAISIDHDVSNVTVENLGFDGQGLYGGVCTGAEGTPTGPNERIFIQNCEFTNNGATALGLGQEFGITCLNGPQNGSIRDNYFHDSGGGGIYSKNGQNLSITGNIFDNVGYGNGSGTNRQDCIDLYADSPQLYPAGLNISITSNVIIDGHRNLIEVQTPVGIDIYRGIVIDGNSIAFKTGLTYSDMFGITIPNAPGCVISNNSIRCSDNPTGSAGIELFTRRGRVIGNSIFGFYMGIDITGESGNHLLIQSNIIENAIDGIEFANDVSSTKDYHYVDILDNLIIDCRDNGIYANGLSVWGGMRVLRNRFERLLSWAGQTGWSGFATSNLGDGHIEVRDNYFGVNTTSGLGGWNGINLNGATNFRHHFEGNRFEWIGSGTIGTAINCASNVSDYIIRKNYFTKCGTVIAGLAAATRGIYGENINDGSGESGTPVGFWGVGIPPLTASVTPLYQYISGHSNAVPASGTHVLGEIVLNDTPASAGFIGWVCTVAGSPGTWKTFGLIS